jgi:hypothetical protein
MFLPFLKTIGIATGVAWVCMALPLYFLGEPRMVWGVVIGCLVSAFCFTLGFYVMCRSFQRSSKALMLSVFGGMLARLVFIGVVMILLIRWTTLPTVSVFASLLGFYILYLIIELYFVHNRLNSQKERYL